jgi:hypothetical protein
MYLTTKLNILLNLTKFLSILTLLYKLQYYNNIKKYYFKKKKFNFIF